ncbi:MAG: hypothetical protein V4735_03020 [Pseudomonadota bacterium]
MTSYLYTDADLLGEPTLDEILADPMIQLVMKRDGVDERDMRGQIERISQRFQTLETVQ